MKTITQDILIIGSGAGGATLAHELSRQGLRRITVLEQGIRTQEVGTFARALRFYDCNPVTMLPKHTEEGVILWRTLMAGGSTVAALANIVPSMEQELRAFGIDLAPLWQEIIDEMEAVPLDESLISDGSRAIAQAARGLGIEFRPMPKAINAKKCVQCAVCPTGCPFNAKWSALQAVDQAAANGVEFRLGAQVKQILIENGTARGVQVQTTDGLYLLEAERVVVAAGGIGTAQLLRRSGVENAGHSLFMDLFVSVVGVHRSLNLLNEPSMAMVCDQFHREHGFILSPYMPVHRLSAFAEFGLPGLALPRKHLLGLMVKTRDDMAGEVFPDGRVSKRLTKADQQRLAQGTAVAREVLAAAGVSKPSILVSKPQGAHPGGTAALGQVVDEHLQVKGVNGLYVCDASVLPHAPGLPPIMTIVALAKWFARSAVFHPPTGRRVLTGN
ncbi:MAG: GMC family oxidoreductase [Anaerolineae bacterium]|nr:GMC family oxidoreductase [Anaerolineae bacterium]